ncbi:MAG: acetyl ornithine aminotransferase family protein [Candidatus Asgardarchaeia archaeon]
MTEVPKIIIEPPGPKAKKILELDEKYISSSFVRFYPLVADHAKGCIVWDVDGNSYIDFNSGLVTMAVGHSHPRVVRAIEEQARKLIHFSNTDFYYEESVILAEKLTQITPGDFPKKIFFGNSGAEANEAALKIVRWHTRRPRIIAFIHAFHGRTYGAMSLTSSKPVQRKFFFPLVPGVTHVPYPNCYRCPFKQEYPSCNLWCVDFIKEEILNTYIPPEEVGAFFFEPIQGEGGYVVPPPEFFKKLKKLADEYGILLVDDEVQAGMGRTGKWFAIEHWGVEPDVITMAKAIASGIPLGAMIARADLHSWEGGAHATTFGGNPIATRVASEVIEIIKEEKLLEKATKDGEYIMKRFKEMMDDYTIIGDIRGKGLMIGVELVKNRKTKEYAKKEAQEIINKAFKRGLAVITAGISTLRIAPPLNIERDLIDKGLEILEDCIREENKKIEG